MSQDEMTSNVAENLNEKINGLTDSFASYKVYIEEDFHQRLALITKQHEDDFSKVKNDQQTQTNETKTVREHIKNLENNVSLLNQNQSVQMAQLKIKHESDVLELQKHFFHILAFLQNQQKIDELTKKHEEDFSSLKDKIKKLNDKLNSSEENTFNLEKKISDLKTSNQNLSDQLIKIKKKNVDNNILDLFKSQNTTNRMNKLEEKCQNQTQQLVNLKNKREDDVLTMKNVKETQQREITALKDEMKYLLSGIFNLFQ